eukprot:GHVT01021880.1.p1 GENE.GHVT01021880.1~~GHVT01021880.1.p1  ORF type:complete len:351 (+),score=76.47 GHVT01021880.1:294-1346(+)
MASLGDQMFRFNVGEDCPVFDGLWDFCSTYSGATLAGARELVTGGFDAAVNWSGGLHHGKKHEASGFCYINDCVLGALELVRHKQRILYVDIDIHHGDGVEEAFYTSPRVMSCSFHKYGDYFPGTGAIGDIGVGEGKGYAVNVPLHDGMDDATFIQLFEGVMEILFERFQPEAVILQCGADSLSGDRLGCFNLSLEGHGHAISFLRRRQVPLLLLGGGGYTLRNVSKCWARETSQLLNVQLDEDIPRSAEFLSYYGPDYKLRVRTSNMENNNDRRHVQNLLHSISDNLRSYVSPIGVTLSANNNEPLPPVVELRSTFETKAEGGAGVVLDVPGRGRAPPPYTDVSDSRRG